MKHGSLFSGIGGFDLAAEWMGWDNLFNCEWEEFPRKILKHHFPNAKQYGDIREFAASDYAGRIDILTGGFPCQPYSVAGKRKGKEDERHLWPEMLRIIRECSPRWIVGENVRGLINWNGGLVFEEVCADLEACGYSVQPFILPAAGINAPHRRDRVWFVAHRDNSGSGNALRIDSERTEGVGERLKEFEFGTKSLDGFVAHNHNRNGAEERLSTGREVDVYSSERNWDAPNTNGTGKPIESERRQGKKKFERRNLLELQNNWETFPTQPPLCGGDDGLPQELDGISFPKWRSESIKAYGNAIVPQVALRIFEAIEEYEKRTQSPPPR